MSNIYIQEPQTVGKVLLTTSVGDIDVELFSKEAPKACRNFVQLCMEGYYDGTIFHRIVPNFIAQGGDPTGTGEGGESIYGQPFKDEFHTRLRFVRRGLVAMANSGPNDNGSQFFFTLGPTPELMNKHTIFAKVSGNTIYNILKLQDGEIDANERPMYPHKIIKTEVLSNPFDDIVPRVIKKKEEETEKKPKSKSKATKNFKLLSFGEEAEEDEEMNIKVSEEYNGNCLHYRLQYNYFEDPEGANIIGNDLYDEYVNSLKASCNETNPICKTQFSTVVSRIFKNVTLSLTRGYRVYKGLRRYDSEDKECELDDIKMIAEKHEFVCMNSKEILKFAQPTGHCINGNEVFKTIEINNDRSWKFVISGQEIEPVLIGLDTITANTVKQVNIIFNTVKQCSICRGKEAEKEQKSTQFRLLQEWGLNDSCSIERRVSSRKCNRILNFNARSSVCPTCKKSGEKGHHASGNTEEITEEKMISQLFPNASDEMINHLKEQSKICQSTKDPRGNRWERDTIRIALNMWNRSPQAYTNLRNSGIIILPSESLLQRYKNCIKHKPGVNHETLKWLFDESNRLEAEKQGGLIFDEMSVQEDLQLSFDESNVRVEGLVDMGGVCDDLHKLNSHKDEVRMAKYVLQFVYLGFDGFRFPIAYFPSDGANAPELYLNIWNMISALGQYGFSIKYACFDGGSSKRAFQLMHFANKEDAMEKNFTTLNPFSQNENITLIMDYSHNIKKIRNNIYASGEHEMCTRKLKRNDNYIVWTHWINAYNWDRSHNTMRVHRKLSDDHIFLSRVSKMRNHLAEEVLNDDMYHLMRNYQESLNDGTHLKATLDLLGHTKEIVKVFRDPRPIIDMNDSRLENLSNFDKWLMEWSDGVELLECSGSEKSKMFLSSETFSDTISMLRGFREICKTRIEKNGKSVVPAGINSDIVENFFCQQRTLCHGSTTNPNVLQYKYGINATILGQSAISKKSNAPPSKKQIQPAPFIDRPLRKKPKK